MTLRDIKRMCATLLFLTLLLTACSDQGGNELTQSESSLSYLSESTAAINKNLSSDQSSNDEKLEDRDNLFNSSTQATESGSSLYTHIEETADIKIIVKKSDLISSQSSSIIDEEQKKRILSFVQTMFESDYTSPPDTGGTLIEVFITEEDGVTKEYSFLETEIDCYRLAKDHQHPDVRNTWYFADSEAFPYLSNLIK